MDSSAFIMEGRFLCGHYDSRRMILELDLGNSRLKARLLVDGQIVDAFSAGYDEYYEQIFAGLDTPGEIRVASVVPARDAGLIDWCRQHWQLDPWFAQVTKACAGVINGYDDVSQMGVDRWLAMVVAYDDCHSASLVVDSGSALTVDMVKADGQHLGGYIVPGLALMGDALFRDTDRVKPKAIDYDGLLSPGRSTQAAVASGCQLMHLGLIETGVQDLLAAGEAKPVIYVTGGAAESLSDALERFSAGRPLLELVNATRVRSDLVLDGLAIAAQDNDNKK